MRTKHIWLCGIAIALAVACSKKESARPPAHKRPGELHVYVDTTGAIEAAREAQGQDARRAALADADRILAGAAPFIVLSARSRMRLASFVTRS